MDLLIEKYLLEYLAQQEMYRAEMRNTFILTCVLNYFSPLDILMVNDAGHLIRIDLGWSIKAVMLSKN